MVRVAITVGSTSSRASHQRSTARTIVITSTGSLSPLRSRTAIGVRRAVGGVGSVVESSTTGAWVILLSPRERFGAADAGGDDGATTSQGRRTAKPCDPPARPRLTAHGVRGRWQVFGLTDPPGPSRALARGVHGTYWPSLPTRLGAQCCVTAVVSAYRCGAVPESHRVPSCPGPLAGVRTSTAHHMGERPPTVAPHVVPACRGTKVSAPAASRAGQWHRDVRPGRPDPVRSLDVGRHAPAGALPAR